MNDAPPSNTAIVLATLVLVLGLLTMMGRQKFAVSPRRLANAYDVSETYVKRRLNQPDMAQFSQLGVDPAAESPALADDNYSTIGTLQAPNGLGEPTTRPWHCVVHFEGRDDQEHDRWKLIFMHVDDDYTYGVEPKD